MKKTLTVNLGGVVFNIDDDAYTLLDSYLNNLRLHFREEAGVDEIMDDIEHRISELFSARLADGLQVVSISIVEEVIARMGKPEEIDNGEDETDSEGRHDGIAQEVSQGGKSCKRLFRNPDGRVLGGVIGGFAAYLGWDATWTRLGFVLVTLVAFKVLIPAYIVCWIVIPEARTVAEKLNMRGEAVTVENIGRTVTEGFVRNDAQTQPAVAKISGWKRIGLGLLQIMGWVLKVAFIVLAVIFAPILFVLGIVLVPLLFIALLVLLGETNELLSLFPSLVLPSSPMAAVVMYFSGILLLGIPLFTILWTVFRSLFNWKPMPSNLKWTLLVLWIVCAMVGGICFIHFDYTLPSMGLLSA